MKMPEQFDQASVLGQLRFSGVLGMVHLRQAGFPARRDVHEFHNRYRVLMRKLALPEDTRSRCASFLRVYDSSETKWQLGKSRVFMHEGLERDLERQRNEERHRAATVIRAHALGYATRKWYRTVLQSVLTIQRSYRTHRWRRRYLLLTATSAFPGTGAIPPCCLTPCAATIPGMEFACPPSPARLDYRGTAEITTPSVLTDENIPVELNDNTNTSHTGTESIAIEGVEEATVLRMEESPVPEVLTTDHESVYLRSHKNHLVLPAREMATDTFQTDIAGSGQSDELAEFGIFIGSANDLNLNVVQQDDTVITRVSDSCHEDGTLAFPDMLHMKQAEEIHLLELPLDKEPMAQPLTVTISEVQCNQIGSDVDVTKAFDELLQVNVALPHCTECCPDIQPIAIGSQNISETCGEQEPCSAGGHAEVVSPYSSEEHGPPLLGAEEAMWLDAEATRAGHEFLESLRFDDIFHCIEESLEGNVAQAVCPPLTVLQGNKSSFATEVTGNDQGLHQENEGPLENEYAEIPELELTTPAAHGASTAVNETGRNEDEDEGFGAEEEVLFRDAALLSKPTAVRLDVVEQLSDQRTSGAHTCSEVDFSSEEQLYANETMDVGIAKVTASPAFSPRACDALVVPSAPYWYELASELDSQTHVYEMVPPLAAVPPATCNPLVQYAMVDNKRVSDSGFFSNRPAESADKSSEASTEPGSPHTNPDEENVYSTVENHDTVFTCSTTFQVLQSSRPVTLDCTYRFSFGSGTKSARARGSSEGTAKGNVSAFKREGIKDALISPSVTDTQNRSCKGELYRNSMCTDQESFREDLSRNNSATGWGNPREQLSSFESEGECVVRGVGLSDEESTLQGESVYSSIGPPFHQGFLSLQESLAAAWKRRWCVLSEGTFTWFRTRQEATLSGWLDKQGQGRPPLRLARRSWKRRWFVLRPSGLAYYDNDREERQRGTIDLASVREVSGDEHRENCFDVITEDRTYRLRAPSQEDASRWLGLLERVRGATEDQLQKMFQESSDPNSALGSLEAGMLDDAYADADHPDRPHTFALVSGSRTLFCNADTADDVQRWLMLLQRSKRDVPGDGGNIILRGWLYKASDASSLVPTRRGPQGPLWASCPRLRRRWFVLTAGALEYYRGSEANAPRAGCLVLTPMCSVSPLDGTHQGRTGNWSFTVYGRRDSYTLYSRQQGEATRWAHAIQRAIDSMGCADTPTSLLIQDIAESGDDPDLVDRTCARNPILRYSPRALLSPLLPLPYGDNHSNPYGYSSLPEEAVRLSLCLLELEGVRDPTPMVQGILQTCWDLLPLRDELYCQLVKQTMTWEGVDGPTMGEWKGKGDGSLNLRVWHLLACTSCTFAPSHAVLRYLHLHLRRALERSQDQELCRYVAFTWTALQCKLCRQSVPSRDEIRALAEGQEISTTIYCHGGGSCPISITSHVTAGEVVARLLRGLGMEGSCSKFALFECGPDGERAIEENALLVDSLARFERLAATREGVDKNQWKIFFKLYLVLNTAVAPEDSIEMAFMFEQAHDSMARGRFPVSGETLQWMAALRLQFVHGNCAAVETEASSYATNSPLEMHLEDFYPTGHSQMLLSSSISTLATSTCTPTTPASPVTPGSGSQPFTFSQDMVPTPPDSTAARVVERSTRGEGLLRRSLREAAGSFLRLRRSRRDRQERAEDDARGQLLTLRAEILAKWRLLHDTNPEQAVAKYMQLVQQWSGYGATLFDVQCTDGQFPRELWLAVSLKSLSVYVRGQAEPIVSFPYERILSFGAAPPADDAHQSLISTPLLPTFQLVIDGREIIFQTTEVAEISKLMEAYINVIMRKRESVHSQSQLCKS